MGMMSGVGSLSQNAVSGSTVQSMAAAVAQMFIPILQQEGSAARINTKMLACDFVMLTECRVTMTCRPNFWNGPSRGFRQD